MGFQLTKESLGNLGESITWSSSPTGAHGQRINAWLSAFATKYDLGNIVDYPLTKDWSITGITIGPIKHPLAAKMYLHLVAIATKKSAAGSDFGEINYFAISKNKDKIKIHGDKFITGSGQDLVHIPSGVRKGSELAALFLVSGETPHSASDVMKQMKAGEDEEGKPVFHVDINKRFEFLAKMTRMIAKKSASGMIVVGTGGLGKSFTIMQTLELMGMKDGEDFTLIKGAKITPVEFFKLLYENHDRLLILDDSDTILGNGDVLNILKGALDTTGTRTCTYISPAVERQGIPTSFPYNGQLIIIANRPMDSFDQAIRSRVNMIDVQMTRKETFQRMEYIVGKGAPSDAPFDSAAYKAAFDLLRNFYDRVGSKMNPERPQELSMRTIFKIAVILSEDPTDKENIEMGEYMLSVS